MLAQNGIVILCTSSPTTPLPGLEQFVPPSLVQYFKTSGRLSFLTFGFFGFWLSSSCALFFFRFAFARLPQLSDRSGTTLARLLSDPLCALRELVLAENFLSDCFIDVLSKDMRKLESVAPSPLRSLDISSNKIRDR